MVQGWLIWVSLIPFYIIYVYKMEIIDQKILHDSVRWPLSPEYQGNPLLAVLPKSKADTQAGDIVVANEDGDKLFYSQEFYSKHKNKIASLGYEPIAVVVVPASHTDDGTARCASLKMMDTSDPENGSYTKTYINFGQTDVPNEEVEGCPSVNLNNVYTMIYGTTTKTDASHVYLATNLENSGWYLSGGGTYPTWNANIDTHDPLAPRSKAYSDGYYVISPYGEDGISKNPYFHLTDGTGLNSYMNGSEMSEYVEDNLLSLEKYENYTGHGWSAVYCSSQYHTIGTKKGDWYIPAIGETCYLWSRIENIRDAYKICSDPNVSSTFNDWFGLMSSTLYLSTSSSYTYIYCQKINSSGGNFMTENAGQTSYPVLAFIKI